MWITRLGEGVDHARTLAPEAVARTVDVLREYRTVLDDLQVGQVRATATSAARDAGNRDDFFAAAHDALGVTPELLSGDEEAALSFLGATADLDAPAPYLVVDIGGGSTEFVLGTDAPTGLVSLDLGCVRVTEQYLQSDPPAPLPPRHRPPAASTPAREPRSPRETAAPRSMMNSAARAPARRGRCAAPPRSRAHRRGRWRRSARAPRKAAGAVRRRPGSCRTRIRLGECATKS